jgi:N-carbamoyl-L-amino-acid hydrolase
MGDLRALGRIGRVPSGGLTRRTFSPEYGEAVRWLRELMTQAGLAARVDAVGNVIGRLGPQQGPAVISGSHIDTVPDGGWLDGAYGVLSAVECARALREADVALRHAFEVIALVDEEGAYLSLFGSRAITGAVTRDEISAARDLRGAPLGQAMLDFGLDPDRFENARRERSDLAAYVELHIEQGPVLERRQVQIGIVEGIVGILGAEYRFTGSADHAGTTPMDARRDALRCAAEFISTTYAQLCTPELGDARFTFGAIEALPGASNVVPRSARVTQEIRSLDPRTIERLFDASRSIAGEAADRLHIDLEVRRVGYNAPAMMDERVMKAVAESCSEAGVSSIRMPSGAGHDAQSFARCCPAGMIFVPSQRGASHRPDEQTDESDLARGADILLRTVCRLAA